MKFLMDFCYRTAYGLGGEKMEMRI